MKAVLVVDLLEDYNLDELKAYVEVSFKDNNQILCGLFNRELKPMPPINNLKIDVASHDRFVDGWNQCVKFILGESDPAKAYPIDETYSPQPVTTKIADLTECKEGKQLTKIIKDTMKELWEKQNDR